MKSSCSLFKKVPHLSFIAPTKTFSNFSCMFLNPNFFSNFNSHFSNLLDLRSLQEQVTKAFCYQELFWPFTVWINCSSNLKFCKFLAFILKFLKFFWSLEHFFLTVDQNNFGNEISFCLFHIFDFLFKHGFFLKTTY